jgi:hypothetical protein
MGHTGDGIDRRRSHCHVELNLLLSERFEEWDARIDPLQPAHTPFHGFNLVGLDIASLYRALANDAALAIPQLVIAQEPYFKVIAPTARSEPEILRRYPWLCPVAHSAANSFACPSWEISLTAAGLPLRIDPSDQEVSYPIVSAIVPFSGKHSWKTMGRVGGTGTAATLTPKGIDYVNLIMGAF